MSNSREFGSSYVLFDGRRYSSTPTLPIYLSLSDAFPSYVFSSFSTACFLRSSRRGSFSHCQRLSPCLSRFFAASSSSRGLLWPPVALLKLLVAPSIGILLFYGLPGCLGLSKLHHLLSCLKGGGKERDLLPCCTSFSFFYSFSFRFPLLIPP